MARDDAQPDNPQVQNGEVGRTTLTWELTLPGMSDRFWRARAPNMIRWLVTRQEDGRWAVSRYPESAANPEPRGIAGSFEEAKHLAEYLARQEA